MLLPCCLPCVQVDEGLKSLDMAMNCGFEDYEKVRSDKNLANLRTSPKFEPLVEKYDEPGGCRLQVGKGVWSPTCSNSSPLLQQANNIYGSPASCVM